MSDSGERNWLELGALWRDDGSPAALADGMARSVHLQTRRRLFRLGAELLASVALVALLLHLQRVHPTRAAERWTALGLANLVALWAFLLLNRIGTWKPLVATTLGFLTLAERRARRALRAARVVGFGLVAELVLIAVWMGTEGLLLSGAGTEEWVFRGCVVAVVLTAALASAGVHRAARAELAGLAGLRQRLESSGEGPL